MPTRLNDRAAAVASAEGVRRTRQASLTELLSGLADARGNGAGVRDTTITLSTHDRSDPMTVISTGGRRLRAAASPSGGRARSTASEPHRRHPTSPPPLAA